MNKNNEINARKLSPEKQSFLREMIARLYEMGKNTKEINETLGAKESLILSVCHKYRKGGKQAIDLKIMGRPLGIKKHLNEEQIKEIQLKIINQTPEEHNLRGYLWDNRNIKKLIYKLYKLEIPRSTLSRYLKFWGFTAQRPIIYNRKQNPVHVEKWLNETYPEIKKRSKEGGCEI